VVIHTRDTIEYIYLVELIEKSRFSYLTLILASKYGMLRLIDNRITFELLAKDFIFPKQKSVSKAPRADQNIRKLRWIG
jgi:hypothetical protein